MKRNLIIIVTALLLFNVTGCGNQTTQNDVKTSSETTVTETENNEKSDDSDSKKSNIESKDKSDNKSSDNSKSNKSAETDKNEEDSKTPSYYGSFKISKVIAHGKVYAGMDESEPIGKSIILSEKSAAIGDETISSPKYSVNTMSKDEFETGYKMPLSDLGITKDSLSKIEIENEQGIDVAYLIIKDENTLIYCIDNVFFEADRI